jgi:lysophospholipase L1-like esterase
MRQWVAAIAMVLALTGIAPAQEPEIAPPVTDPCEVPGYLVFGEGSLERVHKAVQEHKQLDILVIGTGSASLPGPDGVSKAFPARLETALKRLLPEVKINVASKAKSRLTAADMAQDLEKVVTEQKPTLVIWQTGTVDAMRGIDPEDFRVTIDEGIVAIQDAGADVVLMNMQYSPRTESMIQLAAYANNMRVVARDRDVPLFDRLEIMRYWNDSGNFDLNVATKDIGMAQKVHDCVGRALASLVVEAAHLDQMKTKPTQ